MGWDQSLDGHREVRLAYKRRPTPLIDIKEPISTNLSYLAVLSHVDSPFSFERCYEAILDL